MKHQYIIYRMIMDEIISFKKAGLNPNTIVMSSNILYYMLQWEDAKEYYIPSYQSIDSRAKYCGLHLVEAQPIGVCFVCCAAYDGRPKNIFL